jgi:hypothetical protein
MLEEETQQLETYVEGSNYGTSFLGRRRIIGSVGYFI